jgi:hypothetical protein
MVGELTVTVGGPTETVATAVFEHPVEVFVPVTV